MHPAIDENYLNHSKHKLPDPDNSSAGRAEDCRVWRLSLGRWFNSSLSEFLFLSIIIIHLYFFIRLLQYFLFFVHIHQTNVVYLPKSVYKHTDKIT